MINALGIAVCMFIYPIESLFNECNKTVVFTVVIVIYSVYLIFRSLAFKSVSNASLTSSFCIVVVSNVSYKEFRGTIMGLSQTVGSLGRFLVVSAWECLRVGPLAASYPLWVELP